MAVTAASKPTTSRRGLPILSHGDPSRVNQYAAQRTRNMDQRNLDYITDLLRQNGPEDTVLEAGLTDEEVAISEATFGFRFPPDLRALLQYVLPVSSSDRPSFLDWRDGDEVQLRERLDWPADGMCFDIEHNAFWNGEWGPKPNDLQAAFEIARREVAKAPMLIPVFGHRYLPDEPHLAGNPVFSVWQTDIIYYGTNLVDYFEQEFSKGNSQLRPLRYEDLRKIRFWTPLVEEWEKYSPDFGV